MADIDPPWRTDPFQNIIDVHWEQESPTGSAFADVEFIASAGVGAQWKVASSSESPPFPGPEWHAFQQPEPPYTSSGISGAGATIQYYLLNIFDLRVYVSGFPVPPPKGNIEQQISFPNPEDFGSIGIVFSHDQPSAIAELNGTTLKATAYGYQRTDLWWWVSGGPLLGGVQTVPGGQIELVQVTFNLAGSSVITPPDWETPPMLFKRIISIAPQDTPGSISLTARYEFP